jgi:hypothetical protein
MGSSLVDEVEESPKVEDSKEDQVTKVKPEEGT